MKKNLLFVLAFAIHSLFAQTTASFEDFNLAVDSSLNGSDLAGGYSNGNLFFPNTYDTQFNAWSGFSISAKTDVTTPGFMNDLSCIAGEGALNSTTYAVGYFQFPSYEQTIHLTGNARGGAMEGMYVNNSTYAYLSMRDGDSFAKKFGGITGDDPDFFKLKIQKYLNGVVGNELVEFYLADFRFSDNAQDYIINEWTYVDLSTLGNADSLLLTLESSDNGQFGINTPTYVCLDEISTKDGLATGISNGVETLDISVYPNPAQQNLFVKNTGGVEGELFVYDGVGAPIARYALQDNLAIRVEDWASSVYQLVFYLESGEVYRSAFVKK